MLFDDMIIQKSIDTRGNSVSCLETISCFNNKLRKKERKFCQISMIDFQS